MATGISWAGVGSAYRVTLSPVRDFGTQPPRRADLIDKIMPLNRGFADSWLTTEKNKGQTPGEIDVS